MASPALLGSLDNPRLFAGSSVVKAGHETPTQWKHLRGGSSGSDFPAEAAPRGGANNGGEERVDTEAQARESVITQLSDEHGERMVSSLFQSSTAKLAKLGLSSAQLTAWGKSVYMLARRAANCVSPNVQHGDHLNVLHYAAVKLIPSGELCPPEVGEIRGSDAHANVDHGRSECYLYTDGVFARKNLAHKKMRHNIDQPRILLLSGAIEFQRVVSKLAMLDTLLEQEETYMEILVGKIARLQPDILMVGKSVSREAQDMLFKRNISVVLNVEAELMEKVARCTLGMKRRCHSAFMHIDEEAMKRKALELPVQGVAPELITLLPNDGAYEKLHIRKAATPVGAMKAGLVDAAASCKTFDRTLS